MAEKLTPAQFAARIRERHPGDYDDMDDAELTAAVIQKFPDYADMLDVQYRGQAAPAPQSPLDAARARLATGRSTTPATPDRAATGRARVPTPHLDRIRVSGAEVKRRAAAGEEVLQEGLRPGSNAEQFAEYLLSFGEGVAKGTASLGGLVADAARADVELAKRAVGRGTPGYEYFGTTRRVTEAVERGAGAIRRGTGLEGVTIGPAGVAAEVVGEIFAPGPEVVAAMRRTGRVVNRADEALAFYERKIAETTDDAAKNVLREELDRTIVAMADEAPKTPTDLAPPSKVTPPQLEGVLRAPADSSTAAGVLADEAQDVGRGAPDAPSAITPPSAPASPGTPTAQSALTPTPAPKKPVEFGLYTKIREAVDDDWRRVKKLVDDPSTTVTPASNPYDAEIRFHGRVATRIEEARDTVVKIDQDVVRTAKATGVADAQLQREVDEFLQARHAPERNAALKKDGAAGMTDADAAAAMARIAASPHGTEVARIADQIQDLNNQTLDVLREGEVITQELYDTLRAKYKNHVPLNRIMDDTDDLADVLGGRPLDVKSTGIRSAFGSDRPVADITTNVTANLQQAIVRAEKNRVDLATLRFARDNPELGLFTEARPRVKGFAFDGTTPIIERSTDPHVLHLYEDGKAIELRIKDSGLALALRGVNRYKVDGVWRVIQGVTRTFSNLATRFNPEFPLPNKVRDIQEAFIYAYSKPDMGLKGATKTAGRDIGSWKDVLDGIRGADTPGARLYQQMRRDGGTTGGLGLSSRKEVELNIEAIRATNRSAPRMAARQLVKYIDYLNQIMEDSTRLSVYKTALERGLGRDRAAVLAKQASINFNKFGRYGPQINALYMFANASIQGTVKMARAMDPRTARGRLVAGTVWTAVGVAVAATAEWNDSIDPDWRTKVSKYDRLSTLPIVLPPSEDGSFNYLKIPVSWGIKPIKVAADYTLDAMYGKAEVTPGEAVVATTQAAVESVNPVGGTDPLSAAIPTNVLGVPTDLAVDIGRNRGWHGGLIGPEPAWDETMPESERYFRNLPNTQTGALAVEATEELSERGIEVSPADLKYAIDTLGGGSGRFATKVINTLTSIGKGETPDINEVPVASRFVERMSPERLEAQQRALARERAKKAETEGRRKVRQSSVAD